MIGAELKTLRETLGLPVCWLANQAQVRQRTVNYWESGRFAVPDDVEALLIEVETRLHARFLRLKSEIENGAWCLIRYRTDEDLWLFEPDMDSLPASAYAAMLGWLQHLFRMAGQKVQIVWMEIDTYCEWLAKAKDSPEKRIEWGQEYSDR